MSRLGGGGLGLRRRRPLDCGAKLLNGSELPIHRFTRTRRRRPSIECVNHKKFDSFAAAFDSSSAHHILSRGSCFPSCIVLIKGHSQCPGASVPCSVKEIREGLVYSNDGLFAYRCIREYSAYCDGVRFWGSHCCKARPRLTVRKCWKFVRPRR